MAERPGAAGVLLIASLRRRLREVFARWLGPEPWPADGCRCVTGLHTCGRPNVPRWETIFGEKILHDASCPHDPGNPNWDDIADCECYVADLWDAIQEAFNCEAKRV